jgi:hypothetical protein
MIAKTLGIEGDETIGGEVQEARIYHILISMGRNATAEALKASDPRLEVKAAGSGLGAEGGGVIDDPATELARAGAADLADGGGDVGGPASSRSPGVEQHVDGGRRDGRETVATGLLGREFFNSQRAAEDPTDDRNLFSLRKGLRPGDDVFGAVVAVFGERTDGDGSDVAFVDRGGRNVEIRPANDVARANLRRPPVELVGGEHAGAEEGPLTS